MPRRASAVPTFPPAGRPPSPSGHRPPGPGRRTTAPRLTLRDIGGAFRAAFGLPRRSPDRRPPGQRLPVHRQHTTARRGGLPGPAPPGRTSVPRAGRGPRGNAPAAAGRGAGRGGAGGCLDRSRRGRSGGGAGSRAAGGGPGGPAPRRGGGGRARPVRSGGPSGLPGPDAGAHLAPRSPGPRGLGRRPGAGGPPPLVPRPLAGRAGAAGCGPAPPPSSSAGSAAAGWCATSGRPTGSPRPCRLRPSRSRSAARSAGPPCPRRAPGCGTRWSSAWPRSFWPAASACTHAPWACGSGATTAAAPPRCAVGRRAWRRPPPGPSCG
jgi:hypothetical protein